MRAKSHRAIKGCRAEALNGDGLRGKRGGQFYASTVYAVLNNDIHA
jgi:hypothetical protein